MAIEIEELVHEYCPNLLRIVCVESKKLNKTKRKTGAEKKCGKSELGK